MGRQFLIFNDQLHHKDQIIRVITKQKFAIVKIGGKEVESEVQPTFGCMNQQGFKEQGKFQIVFHAVMEPLSVSVITI